LTFSFNHLCQMIMLFDNYFLRFNLLIRFYNQKINTRNKIFIYFYRIGIYFVTINKLPGLIINFAG
jgi:hypothetical protein